MYFTVKFIKFFIWKINLRQVYWQSCGDFRVNLINFVNILKLLQFAASSVGFVHFLLAIATVWIRNVFKNIFVHFVIIGFVFISHFAKYSSAIQQWRDRNGCTNILNIEMHHKKQMPIYVVQLYCIAIYFIMAKEILQQ